MFAVELHRAGLDWYSALLEGGNVTDAMRAGWGESPPLTFGAGDGYVHWTSLACFAARYASEPREMRADILMGIASGLIPPTLDTGELARCDRHVLEDEEYRGGVSCYPRAVMEPVLGLGAGIACGGLIAWAIVAIKRRRESRETSG